jgi:hypothetical protein
VTIKSHLTYMNLTDIACAQSKTPSYP